MKYITKYVGWNLFQLEMELKLSSLPKVVSSNEPSSAESFGAAIVDVASGAFPAKQSSEQFLPSPPWWDGGCTGAVGDRREAEGNCSSCYQWRFWVPFWCHSLRSWFIWKEGTRRLETILFVHVSRCPSFKSMAWHSEVPLFIYDQTVRSEHQ